MSTVDEDVADSAGGVYEEFSEAGDGDSYACAPTLDDVHDFSEYDNEKADAAFLLDEPCFQDPAEHANYDALVSAAAARVFGAHAKSY